MNLNYAIVIYGGKIVCSILNLNYVTIIHEGKIAACSALKVTYVIVIYGDGGMEQHVLI
jgi:hypothetical protein